MTEDPWRPSVAVYMGDPPPDLEERLRRAGFGVIEVLAEWEEVEERLLDTDTPVDVLFTPAGKGRFERARIWELDPFVQLVRVGPIPEVDPDDDPRVFHVGPELPPVAEAELLRLLRARSSMGRALHRALVDVDQPRPADDGPRCESGNGIDPVTNLPDRQCLVEAIDREVRAACAEAGRSFTLLLLDIDRFHSVNEGFGTRQGDSLLAACAVRLRNTVRASDLVFRLGSDEFAVLLPGVDDLADGLRVARRVVRAPGSTLSIDGRVLPLSASVGVAVIDGRTPRGPDEVLRRAGIALAEAKAHGGARVESFDADRHEVGLVQQELRTHVLGGIAREEFFLVYQPIVSLDDGRVVGFETLLRWRHPTLGPLSPGSFLPVLEREGLIHPLGEWIVRRACTDFRELARHRPGVYLTMNVSNRQLLNPGFAGEAAAAIRGAEVDPRQLGFELTETSMVDDYEVVGTNIAALRELGARIFVDDFGVGHSSLTSLHRLAVDALKIDRSFVRDAATCQRAAKIVRTIVDLARSLALDLVAEGVETSAELDAMRAMGCESGQGFLFARPAELESAVELLRRGLGPAARAA